MPSKLDETAPSDRLHIMIPRPLLLRVHRWRGRCLAPPSTSASIRLLLERALDVEGVPRDAGDPDPGPAPGGLRPPGY